MDRNMWKRVAFPNSRGLLLNHDSAAPKAAIKNYNPLFCFVRRVFSSSHFSTLWRCTGGEWSSINVDINVRHISQMNANSIGILRQIYLRRDTHIFDSGTWLNLVRSSANSFFDRQSWIIEQRHLSHGCKYAAKNKLNGGDRKWVAIFSRGTAGDFVNHQQSIASSSHNLTKIEMVYVQLTINFGDFDNIVARFTGQ